MTRRVHILLFNVAGPRHTSRRLRRRYRINENRDRKLSRPVRVDTVLFITFFRFNSAGSPRDVIDTRPYIILYYIIMFDNQCENVCYT